MAGLIKDYISDLQDEFKGYNLSSLQQDFSAGVTVAAVSLPLALAFGVASGVDAASGLIAAIVASFVIGTFSSAPYHISGPTGTMTAVLIPLVARHGVEAVFLTGLFASILLLSAGILRFGKLVYYLPAPVVTGFTSGISLIIAMGQVGNLLGMRASGTTTLSRFFSIFSNGFSPNWLSLLLGLMVMAIMIYWPQKWGKKLPASLAGIFIALAVSFPLQLLGVPIDVVGDIPKTMLHESRLTLNLLMNADYEVVFLPALSVASLIMIESLLCGVACGRMTSRKSSGDRELIAMGIGNLIIPFLGGVPATSAVARSSVAIRSGCQTRLTSVFQGVALLTSMFLLGPLMSRIPLAALAGVLIVAAWRMNEWGTIQFIFGRKFIRASGQFLTTLLCTVIFDLSVAIAGGIIFAVVAFLAEISNVEISIKNVKASDLGQEANPGRAATVIYITGTIFFGSVQAVADELEKVTGDVLILSLIGVPHVDTSAVQCLLNFYEKRQPEGATILFAGANTRVKGILDKAGFTAVVGEDAFFPNSYEAIQKVNGLRPKQEEALA